MRPDHRFNPRRIQITMLIGEIAAIEAWRREQPDIADYKEAIRHLIHAGMAAHSIPVPIRPDPRAQAERNASYILHFHGDKAESFVKQKLEEARKIGDDWRVRYLSAMFEIIAALQNPEGEA